MATQVQFRRGTTADISTFIGADGEVVVDTTKKTCVVHDGIQVAGYPLLREDGSNSALNVGNLSSCALKFINDPNTGIISPGADQIALVTGGASRLSIDSSGSVTIPGNLLVSGSLAGALTLDDGSAAVPALRFTNDPDTGIYLSGTNELAISTGGTQRLTTTTTEVTSTLPIIHPLGAAATPSLTFAGDTNTGIYSSGSDQVAISTGGTQRLTTTTTEVTSTLPVIHPLGAAATPSLTFAGDTNTGIYSPGADQVALATGGTGRLFVDANGNVGIGTASPAVAFQVGATGSNGAAIDATNSAIHGTFGTGGGLSLRAQISSSSGGGDIFLGGSSRGDANVNSIVFSTANTSRAKIDANGYFTVSSNRFNGFEFIDSGATIYHSFGSGGNLTLRAQTTATAGGGEIFLGGSTRGDSNVNAIIFSGANSERARIDSSGRLLVGTSSAQGTSIVQVCGSSTASTEPGDLRIIRGLGVSSIGANVGAGLGYIRFGTFEGAVGATIEAQSDATWSSTSDTPGRLVFSTTADGASSPTERMRITNAGNVGIGTTSVSDKLHIGGGNICLSYADGSTGLRNKISWRTESPFFDETAYIAVNRTGVSGAPADIVLATGGAGTATEKARLTSDGKLLVGTSSVPSTGSSQYSLLVVRGYAGSATGAGDVSIQSGVAAASGIAANEQVGFLHFTDSAGYGFANIACLTDGTAGSGDYPGRLVFSTTADGASSPTERMRITNAGNVGIGTTTPSTLLELAGVSNPQITLNGTVTNAQRGLIFSYLGTAYGQIGQNVSTGEMRLRSGESGQSGYFITFGTGDGSERARIDSSGRLLVGTSSSTGKITIQGNEGDPILRLGGITGGIANYSLDIKQSVTNQIDFVQRWFTSSQQESTVFSIGSGNLFSVSSYNAVVGGTNRDLYVDSAGLFGYVSSTLGSKKNIYELGDVGWLYGLRPVSFNRRRLDDNKQYTEEVYDELEYGLIAEDVEQVAPELCFYDIVDGQSELRGVHYSKLIAPLLKAVQDLKIENENLKARVTALEP
jgi:hypothetical protein